MLSRINSTIKAIWKKMKSKEYRDSFVSANISNTISAQIHTMRQVRGWTQSDLAARCDMRQPRISALEDPEFENVEITTLRRIASAFDVALIVQFVPFSEVARLSTTMTSTNFNVADFSSDSLAKARPIPGGAGSLYNISFNSGGSMLSIANISTSANVMFHGINRLPEHIYPAISIPLGHLPTEGIHQLH